MTFKKIKGVVAVFTICGIFALSAGYLEIQTRSQAVNGGEVRYVLDAGHGIPDGGAVGGDGTTEQTLNLAITLKISALLDQNGIKHLLTRSDENSIFSEGKTIHAKKVSDVQNRIAIAEQNKNIPLISIHMNSYPSASVHGIQVFYGKNNETSKKIAESLQEAFNGSLQPDNRKTVKTISDNIYLFSHVSNPSVLIECGFLTNDAELALLKTEDYQQKLSEIIAQVLMAQG